MNYLLPCPNCDANLNVSPTDAGRTLTCEACGQEQKAPSLGAIKRLTPVESSAPAPAKSKSWSTLQGIVFGTSLIILIIGGVGLFQYVPAYLTTKAELEELLEPFDGKLVEFDDLESIKAQFDALPVRQLANEWRKALQSNVDKYQATKERAAMTRMEENYQSMVLFGVVAAVGAVGLVIAVFLP